MSQTRSNAGPRQPKRQPLDPARAAAFEVLRAVSERDAYANLALPALLRERGITGRDAAFATELTYGTCRTRGLLDAVIGAAAGRPPDAIDPVLLDLLRLGTYQLLRTRVDAHAAVSTTVEQAGIEFDSARAGFVNGVLRTIAGRDEKSWVDELAPDPATRSDRARRVRARPSPLDRPGLRRRAGRGRRRTRRAAGQRRRTAAGAPGGPPGRADRRRAGRRGRRHRRPLLAVCGVPAGRRPRAAGAGARRRRPWSRTRAASWWPAR